jgi:hypothetical protein
MPRQNYGVRPRRSGTRPGRTPCGVSSRRVPSFGRATPPANRRRGLQTPGSGRDPSVGQCLRPAHSVPPLSLVVVEGPVPARVGRAVAAATLMRCRTRRGHGDCDVPGLGLRVPRAASPAETAEPAGHRGARLHGSGAACHGRGPAALLDEGGPREDWRRSAGGTPGRPRRGPENAASRPRSHPHPPSHDVAGPTSGRSSGPDGAPLRVLEQVGERAESRNTIR